MRFSDLYDGEIFDATFVPRQLTPAVPFHGPRETLIPQEGEPIREQERISAARIFTTPKGERVIDFGQEFTGFLEVSLVATAGEPPAQPGGTP